MSDDVTGTENQSSDEVFEIQGDSVTAEESASDELGAPDLRSALEALLLVADEPMTTATLATLTRTPEDQILDTLRDLSAEYTEQGRGFDLKEIAGGWRFWTRADCAGVVERFVLDGQHARLTQAALETLAVVAYRQPVTRSRISAIRGVNVDSVVRNLVARGLIEEVGHDHETGAHLYQTTTYFLERLGLKSLEDLPPIAEHLPMPDNVEAVLDLANG
ncbi:MAG: SMC-Scp complex subunit ScpB [Actinobacteria bacterium]|nr:SMC-Scp complex subunit ScpB [Actinomycetota bacterium]